MQCFLPNVISYTENYFFRGNIETEADQSNISQENVTSTGQCLEEPPTQTPLQGRCWRSTGCFKILMSYVGLMMSQPYVISGLCIITKEEIYHNKCTVYLLLLFTNHLMNIRQESITSPKFESLINGHPNCYYGKEESDNPVGIDQWPLNG